MSRSSSLFQVPTLGLWLALSLFTMPSMAQLTDISNTPLVAGNAQPVKPNLLFTLDDSGSMGFDFMPDHTVGGLCRQTGAGLVTGNNYSGTFGRACCEGGNASNACWVGAAPFSRRGHPPFLASAFNTMAYNPATRYLPPVTSSNVPWKSMTAANSSNWTSVPNDAYNVQNTGSINLITGYPDVLWCPNAASPDSDCLRNGNYVLPGRVNGIDYTTYRATTSSGTGRIAVGAPDAATLQTVALGPHYYRIVPSEYCKETDLRDCVQGAAAGYDIPAPVRWCRSDAISRSLNPARSDCQAVRTNVFSHARYPTKYFSGGVAAVAAVPATAARTPAFTIALNGCGGTGPTRRVAVGPLIVGGVDLFAGATTAQESTANNVANRIRNLINSNTATTGFSAGGSNASVQIVAPVASGNLTATASLQRHSTSSAGCTFTPTTSPAFAGFIAATPAVPAVPAGFAGSFERIDILPNTEYAKGPNRDDCVTIAGKCSYDEEMTNFANWWTYHHTRMQTMKSGASRAFAVVGANRRVGYASINNATTSDFLNIDDFEQTQKDAWFAKLFAARPSGGTPLRRALANAGRLYAGRLTTFNNVPVKDPMLASCQRNFTILSTDGFWNEADAGGPVTLDGSTLVGDQDGNLPVPQKDRSATPNTLADVAAYYFKTDLRTGTLPAGACLSGSSGKDVCGVVGDTDELQNMRTLTLGLGASGFMQFNPKYLTESKGDYHSVANERTADAANGVCSWQTTGQCTWPTPVNNQLTTIDDLWHAAVNGVDPSKEPSFYFSATDPASLYSGLQAALTAIEAQTRAAASATTSNPNVSAGDNQVFISNFRTKDWYGDLESRRVDIDTGLVSTGAPEWSARPQLDANTNRRIKTFDSTSADKLRSLDWDNLSAAEKAFFQAPHITAAGRALSQFCSFGTTCLSAADQATAAGRPLLDFVLGDRTNEGPESDTSKYFRQRVSRLGDIVSSEAVFVGKPSLSYTGPEYATYKATTASRPGMVYVGANDGMLHAFDATTGEEVWAYVPSAVIPNLYRLADKEYASKHAYFVDSTPTVADVLIAGEYRTVLVGGLGAGGRSYYALDVTDPANPKALWEITNTTADFENLGLSVGKPEIGKLDDTAGTWAVFFGSGYNNVGSSGNGRGYLFVVNAATGARIAAIDTGVGSNTTPSGMAHIRAWLDDAEVDGTVRRVYGGDNLGNVWRFDVNGNIGAPGIEAQRLVILRDDSDNPQPITSRPELGQVGTFPMVYVGTGRYMGTSDLTYNKTQSIYGIKDRLTADDFGDVRDTPNRFVKQVLQTNPSAPNTRTMSAVNPVNLATDGGCYVDLPTASERVNTDPQLALGTLVVNSNVIDGVNQCKVGGNSWANFLDYRTCGSVKGSVVSVSLGNALATRPSLVKLPNNKVISITRLSDDRTVSTEVPVASPAGVTRRLSWRDLVRD